MFLAADLKFDTRNRNHAHSSIELCLSVQFIDFVTKLKELVNFNWF